MLPRIKMILLHFLVANPQGCFVHNIVRWFMLRCCMQKGTLQATFLSVCQPGGKAVGSTIFPTYALMRCRSVPQANFVLSGQQLFPLPPYAPRIAVVPFVCVMFPRPLQYVRCADP